MSLVDSCPSTEARSNERLTHTPSSRSARLGRERGVGLRRSTASWRSAARSCRRPCTERSAARFPTAARTSRLARFSNASVVWIACWKSASPSRRSRSRAPQDALERSRRPGASWLMPPVEASATSAGSTPDGQRRRALRLGGVVEPAPAGGGVRAARVGEHRAQRAQAAALAAEQHRRRRRARGGEARRADRGLRVAHEQADVGRCRWP